MTEETTTTSVVFMTKVVNEDAVDAEEPRKEEKLTSIMEAANALTALGDEDEVATDAAAAKANTSKDDRDDGPPVDKPIDEDPSSMNEASSAVPAAKAEPKKESSSSAASRKTTPAATATDEDGTVISTNSGGTGTTSTTNGAKRHLPEHKKPDAAPTFPEKVRLNCVHRMYEKINTPSFFLGNTR